MTQTAETALVWRSRVFLAGWTLYAGYYICRRDMGASGSLGTHLAIALACFGMAYAAGQLAGGQLADRWSARNTALAGAAISILCTLLLAWAPPEFNLPLQIGNGFGQGFGWPAILKLIGVWFRRGERDRVLGWWSTSYILGGFLATSLAAWVVMHTGFVARSNFHPAFVVSSFVLLCAALFFAHATRGLPQPEFTALRFPHAVPQGADPSFAPKNAAPWNAWKEILGNRTIQIVSATYFFLKMTRYTLLFWLPHYLMSTLDSNPYSAARTASFLSLFGFAGPIAVGYAVERWLSDRRLDLGAGMLFALAFVYLLHPLLANNGWFSMIVSISLMGILIHGADLLISGMTVLDVVPDALQGRAVGFVNSIGSIGQALSPLLATVFVARMGWTKLFDLFVFFALAAGAICAFGASYQTRHTSRTNRSELEPSDLAL